jgi:hypothetical protein
MYLAAVKLRRISLWAAFAAGFLALLFPRFVPLEVPLVLAISCGILFFYTILHVRNTKRSALRCPACGWVPLPWMLGSAKNADLSGTVSAPMACAPVAATSTKKRPVSGADEFSRIDNGSPDEASVAQLSARPVGGTGKRASQYFAIARWPTCQATCVIRLGLPAPVRWRRLVKQPDDVVAGGDDLLILPGSLAVKHRVFYLDGKKEPQAQG